MLVYFGTLSHRKVKLNAFPKLWKCELLPPPRGCSFKGMGCYSDVGSNCSFIQWLLLNNFSSESCSLGCGLSHGARSKLIEIFGMWALQKEKRREKEGEERDEIKREEEERTSERGEETQNYILVIVASMCLPWQPCCCPGCAPNRAPRTARTGTTFFSSTSDRTLSLKFIPASG